VAEAFELGEEAAGGAFGVLVAEVLAAEFAVEARRFGACASRRRGSSV
jgi:hypothetical protein